MLSCLSYCYWREKKPNADSQDTTQKLAVHRQPRYEKLMLSRMTVSLVLNHVNRLAVGRRAGLMAYKHHNTRPLSCRSYFAMRGFVWAPMIKVLPRLSSSHRDWHKAADHQLADHLTRAES